MQNQERHRQWKQRLVSPEKVLYSIKPGLTIFFGSGVAEPRTLMKCLIDSGVANTSDLEVIQLTSHSDMLSLKKRDCSRLNFKTFISTMVSADLVVAGNVDLIPARISQIPRVIKSRRIPIDVAIVQITPPSPDGYCSLGVAIDAAREAMQEASLVVGEINHQIPFTFGDTIVSISDFDLLVESEEPPIYFKRWPVNKVIDQVAANISQIIEDGDCLSFSTGPLFEALGKHLAHKRHLGIHSSYFTDTLMDLVKSGAVTNYRKGVFRGKAVASYALGTPELMNWLNHNPLVEFQGIEQVFNPAQIGRNPNMVVIENASKVDLLGRISFSVSRGNIVSGPGQTTDLLIGAELSPGGRTIVGLPSRNNRGAPNIVAMLRDLRNQFHMRESIDAVVTEYGIANLKWRSLRERALALIDIAHPDDREGLVRTAKEKRILPPDQVYPMNIGRYYPLEIMGMHEFKPGVRVRFRPTKPSDEAAMRHLFYRFSKKAIHSRFFYPISIMSHRETQEYINIDYSRDISIVALRQELKDEIIIAEARFVINATDRFGDLAFIVDEGYHGLGIASYMYRMLIRLAKERGLKGLFAEVLEQNHAMLRVLENGGLKVFKRSQGGIVKVAIPFEAGAALPKRFSAGPEIK